MSEVRRIALLVLAPCQNAYLPSLRPRVHMRAQSPFLRIDGIDEPMRVGLKLSVTRSCRARAARAEDVLRFARMVRLPTI